MPADAELTARPEEIPAWDDVPTNLKPVCPPDGGLRWLPGAHRPCRSAGSSTPGDRRARRHAGLLHRR